MATLPIKAILQVTHYSHHHGLLGQEAPNQTFKLGNLINLNAGGQFVETGAGAAATTAKNRLAAAEALNSANPNRKLPYVVPTETMVLEITAGGAASTATLLQPGTEYGVAKDPTTGYHYLNLADTTNKVFRLVWHNGQIIANGGGAVGDFNNRVYAVLTVR